MRRNLVKAGAVTALVGGTVSAVGAIFNVIFWLSDFNVPLWLQRALPISSIGLATFTIGASLALLGLASE